MLASINDLPAGDQPSLYLTAYQAWLITQPLSVHTRRAYLSRLRLFAPSSKISRLFPFRLLLITLYVKVKK